MVWPWGEVEYAGERGAIKSPPYGAAPDESGLWRPYFSPIDWALLRRPGLWRRQMAR